jgi:hypothetical protein
MCKKGEPRANIRIIASGIAKNNNFIKRYSRLDAQLDNCMFQLNQAATTQTLVGVMTNLNKIFKVNEGNIDAKEIQKTVMQFQMQLEKQDLMAEQLNEVMEVDDEDEEDEVVDRIIDDIEFKMGGGGK